MLLNPTALPDGRLAYLEDCALRKGSFSVLVTMKAIDIEAGTTELLVNEPIPLSSAGQLSWSQDLKHAHC